MFRRGSYLILGCILLGGLTAQAGTYRRLVNFEWESIEEATAYDIEFKLTKENISAEQESKENSKEKTFSFQTKEAAWNGKLAPGKYVMRLRARDYRGVPGDWSPFSDFNVGLDSTQIKSPAPHAKFRTKADTEVTVPFAWTPVGGANGYHFEITSEDGVVKISEDVKENKWSGKLPVAKSYSWKVRAFNDQKIESEATTVGDFSLIGRPLDPPRIEIPESSFVREVKWQRPDKVDSFDVYILKYNPEQRKWEKFQTFEDYKENVLPFQQAWPGGKYQTEVRAKGQMRVSSQLAKARFHVHNGDRSPASEYTALVRKSIDRVSGWYGIASYLVTQIQFSSYNSENSSSVRYNALGGTGRLGGGWLSPNTPWGFLGIIDMSGFTVDGKTNSYASCELNSIYKQNVSDRGEYRIQMGVYYKEMPETIGIGDASQSSSFSTNIKAAGPHLGAEYWYSLSPKLGLQLNMHLYMSMFKISTPNGQALSPSLSTQVGFLGSYRFTQTFTGLVGYARREDKLAYKGDPSNITNPEAGDTNTTNISGNYLNLFAEWSF